MPLCVDLDGTLIRTDLLHEGLINFLRLRPGSAWRLPLWLAAGRGSLKRHIAAAVPVDAAALPYRQAVVDYLRAEHAAGRTIILATASPLPWARAVADHLGVFAHVEATDAVNLKGAAKAAALVRTHGEGGYDYIGDHDADRPVWSQARLAHRAGRGAGLALGLPEHRLGRSFVDDGRSPLAAMLKAARPHQWLKNLLLVVPLIASHQVLAGGKLASVLLAFIAFSLIASATYLINDLLDLASDRAHPRKRRRPFASGDLGVAQGLWAIVILLALGAAVLPFLPIGFAGVLLVYTILTLLYSFRLKRAPLADILVLACLYSLRIVAGATAAHIAISSWLLAFSMFTFINLAAAKRCAELANVPPQGSERIRGRGYFLADLEILGGMGSASSFCAVLVMAIYTQQPYVAALYKTPTLLWLICPLLLYWLNRILLLARRGHMDDDPIIFAVTDRISLAVLALAGAIASVATFVKLDITLVGVS